MISRPKRRHKLSLEPISYEELSEASNMRGMLAIWDKPEPLTRKGLLTFMDPAPITAPPPDSLELPPAPAGPLTPPVNLSGGSPDILDYEIKSFTENDLRIGPPDKLSGGRGDPSAPRQFITLHGRIISGQCQQWTDVQTAHTYAEQQVYTSFWALAGATDKRDDAREAIIPLKRVAKRTGGSFRNVERVVASLVQKLAIEITEAENKPLSTPRRYMIYGMAEIISRRKEAGYHFVYINRNTKTLARLYPPDNLTGPPPDKLSGHPPVSLAGGPPDRLAGPPPVSLSGLLRSTQERSPQRTSDVDDFTPILESLIRHTGPCDDQAASKLLADCRAHAPDATVEEVADLLHQTAVRLIGRRNVTSPRGLLLSTVPLQFQPVALGIYRRQKLEGQRIEQEQREWDRKERVRTAREILEDAFISADLRQWAQDILAEAGEQSGAEQ